jgi:hypothetical protein
MRALAEPSLLDKQVSELGDSLGKKARPKLGLLVRRGPSRCSLRLVIVVPCHFCQCFDAYIHTLHNLRAQMAGRRLVAGMATLALIECSSV